MKKFYLLVLVSVFVFSGCSDNDDQKQEVTISFEGKLTGNSTEFVSVSTEKENANDPYSYFMDTFKDNSNLLSFRHLYNDWGSGYTFAGFTYMNSQDNATFNSPAPISGKGKTGTVYLAVNATSYSPAEFTINNPQMYNIKCVWVTNSTYAYKGMIEGDGYADKFTKGSWFKLTATGYDSSNIQTGIAVISLADYKSNDDKPVSEWILFDLSPLNDAEKVKFELSSSDVDEYGMKTAGYFCMDGVTLIGK